MTQLLIPSPPTAKEDEDLQTLSSIMGTGFDSAVALRLLRKFNGDLEKTADAILSGDKGLEMNTTTAAQRSTTPKIVSTAPNNTVIDLTEESGDNDEEMSRALQMSLETDTSQSTQATFGPSNREPDSNWAVVPTNNQQNVSHEDEMQQAIKASLAVPEDSEEQPCMDDMIRLDGRPVALRASNPGLVYAAMLVHALFHVPQMRKRSSRITGSETTKVLENLAELYTNLDMALLSVLDSDDTLFTLGAIPSSALKHVREWSTEFLDRISGHFDDEAEPDEYETTSPLDVQADPSRSSTGEFGIISTNNEAYHVPVEINGSSNDLISHLSTTLDTFRPDGSSEHDAIMDPSEILVFSLARKGTSQDLEPFSYPKTMFMDRFIYDSRLAQEKRLREKEIRRRLEELEKKKNELTRHHNNDTLKGLRSSIHYFENIARKGNVEGRTPESLADTAGKLKKVLAGLEAAVEKINAEVKKLQSEVNALFDVPELQQHRYDLRAVLMYTGVPGRKQMYSYVQDDNATWWKTLDHSITEASESDALTDPTGLHLGAGPYMLVYARHVTTEDLEDKYKVEWPGQFVANVIGNNERLASSLKPEILAKVQDGKQKELKASDGGKKKVVLLNEKQDVSMMDIVTSTTRA